MIKTILNMLAGAVLLSAGAALAVTGQPPLPANGPGLVDGAWLDGLAGGLNYSYQYGVAAAGTNQATATQLPTRKALIQVDTVGASTGVALPPCYQGVAFSVYNNTATSLTVYPAVANNPTTGAQDTINNTTSVAVAGRTLELFSCAKNGVWAAK